MKPEPFPEDLAAENQRLREALAKVTARAKDLTTRHQDLTTRHQDLAKRTVSVTPTPSDGVIGWLVGWRGG